MRYENNVTINRPAQEVFAYISDPANLSTWQSVVLEAHDTSSGPPGVGSTVDVTGKFLGRQVQGSAEITEWDPPSSMAARTSSGPFPLELRYTLTPQNGTTQVAMAVDIDPGRFFGLAGPVLEPVLKRQAQSDLETLKALLETR